MSKIREGFTKGPTRRSIEPRSREFGGGTALPGGLVATPAKDSAQPREPGAHRAPPPGRPPRTPAPPPHGDKFHFGKVPRGGQIEVLRGGGGGEAGRGHRGRERRAAAARTPGTGNGGARAGGRGSHLGTPTFPVGPPGRGTERGVEGRVFGTDGQGPSEDRPGPQPPPLFPGGSAPPAAGSDAPAPRRISVVRAGRLEGGWLRRSDCPLGPSFPGCAHLPPSLTRRSPPPRLQSAGRSAGSIPSPGLRGAATKGPWRRFWKLSVQGPLPLGSAASLNHPPKPGPRHPRPLVLPSPRKPPDASSAAHRPLRCELATRPAGGVLCLIVKDT
ncbi:basic proline-rich protein-like [Hyaena hyaena]|uniref:basic proline-rich protein-like n=1 Tax=Hyaena hyaena TaxID=95912 RepID=UPI001922914E|nr:basic proline-rich protein-like [Hyaena hyaena]